MYKRQALEQVEATGYGIVMPSIGELQLEEPEIVRQGGRYGVRLQASAPSIHLLKATIHTEKMCIRDRHSSEPMEPPPPVTKTTLSSRYPLI